MGFLAYFFLPLGPADCGYGSSCCGRSAGEPRITPHWFCTCAMLSIVGCLVMCMKQMCEIYPLCLFFAFDGFFQDVPFPWIIEMLRCLTPSLWIIPLGTARFKRDSQIDGLRSQGPEIDFSHLICQYLMGLISGEQWKKECGTRCMDTTIVHFFPRFCIVQGMPSAYPSNQFQVYICFGKWPKILLMEEVRWNTRLSNTSWTPT